MITIYGIKTCDTMKKARDWLDDHGVAYAFHDYRAEGIDAARLKAWVAEAGLGVVLNKASTTFKELPDAEKAGLNEARALKLMLANPTMIKRPVLDLGDRLLIGFKPAVYAEAFSQRAG